MNKRLNIISAFRLPLILLLLISVTAFAADNAQTVKKVAAGLSVTNAFFYVPLGKSKNTTAFFTITNNSSLNLSVTGISSPAAKQVRLMPDGTLQVPAKQSVALKSSGRYVEITDLASGLSTGDELYLALSLSNGQIVHVIARAQSAYDQPHGR